LGVDRPLVEEGNAEVEIGERAGCEGFDEDIDDNVWVVKFWVELVPVQRMNAAACTKVRYITVSVLPDLQGSHTLHV
jgi:hypothetical protein